MPKPLSFGHLAINLSAGQAPESAQERSKAPFRILVLGDFSGRTGKDQSARRLAGSQAIFIDRDNFDEVLANTNPELHLRVPASEERTPIWFASLDDFHPDRIFEQLEVFQELRTLRERLNNPSTFAGAAAELRGQETRDDGGKAVPQPGPVAATVPNSKEDLIEQMLERAADRPQEREASALGGSWQSFLQSVVAPFLAPRINEAQQAELVALVDELTGHEMRRLLHEADFKELESAWRALFLLVRRLDTGTSLRVHLLDCSKSELMADLRASDDLSRTALYRVLVDQAVGTAGGLPWGLVVGNYTFGPSADDMQSLGRMARIAYAASAPFIAAADSRVLGCDSIADTPDPIDWRPDEPGVWESLRRLPDAVSIALALPRVLLRLPYGKETEPIERFHFEELPDGDKGYLWGNSAFLCALALGDAFTRSGWDLEPDLSTEIDGLPLHLYREDGEDHARPCAEAALTDRAVAAVLDCGLSPVIAIAERDAVRLVIQSCAGRPLFGRWG
jgi:type VI secretion system protein ImpC